MTDGPKDPRDGIGGNKPPTPLEEFKTTVKDKLASITSRLLALKVSILNVGEITDEPKAATALDFVKQCKIALGDIEDLRKELKKPLDEQVKHLQETVKGTVEPMETAMKALVKKIGDFQAKIEAEKKAAAEAARKAAEEAATKAREEAEAKQREAEKLASTDRVAAAAAIEESERLSAAATAADVAVGVATKGVAEAGRIRGGASLGTNVRKWTFEIVDITAVPPGYLTLDEEAVGQSIAEAAKDRTVPKDAETMPPEVLTIPGLRIFRSKTFSVR